MSIYLHKEMINIYTKAKACTGVVEIAEQLHAIQEGLERTTNTTNI